MNYTSLEEPRLENSIVTIGVFDGVHQGHFWLIQHLLDSKNEKKTPSDYATVVVTFDPHPKKILSGDDKDYYLTTTPQKLSLLNQIGVDHVLVIPFSKEIAGYTADEFVSILSERLGMKELWVGDDFALGKDRVGDIPQLSVLGERYGFSVHSLKKTSAQDQVISSTRIRDLLKAGEIAQANAFLNRPYSLSGEVVVGDQRGRTIGFPTANVAVDEHMLIPKFGVYAAYAIHDGKRYTSVLNIGVRPTFDATELRIEVHLIDFPNQDIYGDFLTIEFVDYIREEKKFDGLDALMQQIEKDKNTAIALLS